MMTDAGRGIKIKNIFIEKYDPVWVGNDEIMKKGIVPSPWFWVPVGAALALSPLGLVHVGWLIAIAGALGVLSLVAFFRYLSLSNCGKQEMKDDLRPFSRKRMYFNESHYYCLNHTGATSIPIYREKLKEYLDALRSGHAQDRRVEKYLSHLCYEAWRTSSLINESNEVDLLHIIDESQLEALRAERRFMEEIQ